MPDTAHILQEFRQVAQAGQEETPGVRRGAEEKGRAFQEGLSAPAQGQEGLLVVVGVGWGAVMTSTGIAAKDKNQSASNGR